MELIELPVCNGMVAGAVLVDAIASEFAWPILRSLFSSKIPKIRSLNGRYFYSHFGIVRNWLEAYFYNPETADEAFTINLDTRLDCCGG